MAFAAVKYLGAAYLCFLGVRMIIEARQDVKGGEPSIPSQKPNRNPFWQGVTTEVLNPKTALFFLSFIPQFVNRESGHVFLQFLMLGSVSVGLNTSADLVVTALAGPFRQLRPFLCQVQETSTNGHGSDHDWIGNVFGDERKVVEVKVK